MSRYIKIALGLIAVGVVLTGIGRFFGGSGFFITNGLNTYSQEDLQIFEYTNMEIGALDSIDISVSNVPVTFRASEGDKFGVEVKYQVVDLDDIEVSVNSGELVVKAKHDNYWWSFDFSAFSKNDVEEYVVVYVPSYSGMDEVKVSTSNAPVDIKNKDIGSKINVLDINTSNAGVTLSGAYVTDSLVVDTSNASIRLDEKCICAKKAKLITSNADVTVLDANVNDLDVKSSNGEIVLELGELFEQRRIKADTSNAGIYVKLQKNSEIEADIKADTSNGEVYINGKSVGDDDYEYATSDGVKLELDTSNGNIKIEFGLN